MARRKVPLHPHAPYHVCARSVNQEWFTLDMETMWSITENYLYLVAHLFAVRIHSFVLMSNHFHLIVSAPRGNMSEMLRYFMREVSREVSRLTGRINQTWGGRNHKTCIVAHHYFVNTYKYVYRNPVRAKICARVEDYEYSTLAGLIGLRRLIIPVCEDTILFKPNFDASELEWLNTPSLPERDEEMRKALRRTIFTLPKPGRVMSPLEFELL